MELAATEVRIDLLKLSRQRFTDRIGYLESHGIKEIIPRRVSSPGASVVAL
jgi:hypothetical protein